MVQPSFDVNAHIALLRQNKDRLEGEYGLQLHFARMQENFNRHVKDAFTALKTEDYANLYINLERIHEKLQDRPSLASGGGGETGLGVKVMLNRLMLPYPEPVNAF